MDLGPFRVAVKKRMEAQGLNQSDLARMLEGRPAFPNFPTAQKWLSKYLLGGSDPPALPLLSVCETLGIPLDEIGLPEPPRVAEAETSYTKGIPVIAFVSAGRGDVQFTDQGYPVGNGMEMVPRPSGLDDPNAFGVMIHGDSMSPKYENGDVVFVDTRVKPSNGDSAVVGLHSHERYVKRWRRKGSQVALESVNPEYPPIIIPFPAVKFAYRVKWVREK
jgi:SOS-response transcriptional repressor LexA